ncbi:UDP-3-O-acyl-N-acetylglucosamine deacetylase [Chlamydia sp.]|uniref:UDP-3-O-acyl-N-acetylglucosamine deacetylase n=1 Tax=Chlamydia sp. TaxID=35827 RepID=UPI0025C6783A|nr:UDP-3-O-acyl-N-acetylglucosamine deacetylase [Chlamydia sp.]MBQ8498973.1 UDP-3-O-acyl-N-acetylglucosamine deacetylase [Chlamydia sp.]
MVGRAQRTLKRRVCYSGVGVHFGKAAMLTLEPAEENTGVVFLRHTTSGQCIPAQLANVCGTGRSTTLSLCGDVVSTVEHLLAALYAFGVDNVRIHCSEDEIPIGDGSAQVFIDLIDRAGIEEQEQMVRIAKLARPVYYQTQDTILAAFPSEEFKISYTLHYSHNSAIGTQYRSLVISEESFRKEIAPCRTFALYSELCFLMEKGLIGGGCLGNAVLFKDDSVVSLGKLRFSDEPVRHKILDLIGDLSLVAKPFVAHIVAVGSGHSSNVALGNKILEALQHE